MHASRLALLLLAGCTLDNAIGDGSGPDPFSDADPVTPPVDTDTGTDPGPDTDTEEPAGCPPLDLGGAGTVPITEACEAPAAAEVSEPWEATVELQFGSGASGVIVMPTVGNLTDDNDDGVVDDADTPDIAFTVYGDENLVAIHGDGSGVIFNRRDISGSSGAVIADVDGDGTPEVVVNGWRQITAVRADGSELWRSSNVNISLYTQPVVCDLEGDGVAEVITDGAVVSGADGAIVGVLNTNALTLRAPVCADLDQDGTKEILLGDSVYRPDGTVLWHNRGDDGQNFAAVLDVDGDTGGEALFVSRGHAYLHDEDGTELLDFEVGPNPGPPCVADFDGDGESEIAVPGGDQLSVFEVDGTPVWSAPMSAGLGMAGCSGFDVNADGAYEVLLADADAFRIHDGATGAVRYEDTGHSSQTLYEYPVVADVDADGSAEIVVATNMGTTNGITVYGHAHGEWPRSGPTWATHDFAVTNLDADGHVPATPEASWLAYNLFRARPATDERSTPDLVVDILDFCVADCEAGPVQLSVQIANLGGEDVEAGAFLSLYADDDGVLRPIATATLPAVPAGTQLDGILFELSPADLGADGIVAVVDDDGTGRGAVRECDETNNRDAWVDAGCGS